MPPGLDLVNHCRPFDPLIGGIRIICDQVNHPGTLGAIAADGAQLYLLSNYHVLCEPNGNLPPPGAGLVYQPDPAVAGGGVNPPVADLDPARADNVLDCAAAALRAGVMAEARVLGIGRVLGVAAPAVGMRVIKSGIRTGVTEGVITAVNGSDVSIGAPPESPLYDCSDGGDSGALWLERDTHLAVALHRAGALGGLADAADITAVLTALNLQLYI
jgi:hypothetical protein